MEDFEQLQLQNTFSSRDVIMNFHNNRTWEDENLNAINKSRHQYQFSVNVWVVIVADPLIQFFFAREPNETVYHHFLEDIILLEDVPVHLN